MTTWEDSFIEMKAHEARDRDREAAADHRRRHRILQQEARLLMRK